MSHDYKADLKMAKNGCDRDSSRDKICIQISKWPSIIWENNIRPFRVLYTYLVTWTITVTAVLGHLETPLYMNIPEQGVIELFSLVLLELRNLDPCFDHYNLYRLCNSYHTLEKSVKIGRNRLLAVKMRYQPVAPLYPLWVLRETFRSFIICQNRNEHRGVNSTHAED